MKVGKKISNCAKFLLIQYSDEFTDFFFVSHILVPLRSYHSCQDLLNKSNEGDERPKRTEITEKSEKEQPSPFRLNM